VRRLLLVTPAELTRDVRARRAAAAAVEQGYEVIGLCAQVSGESPVPFEGVRIVRTGRPARVDPRWFGNSAARAEGRAKRELRALFRLARLLARSARLWRAGRGVPDVDVVHANDLDTLPAGFALARSAGARLVYDAHELYSEFEKPTPRLARRLLLMLEGSLARRADAVVTVSDGVARELQTRLRLAELPLVVTNAPASAEIAPTTSSEGPLRAVYQGGLGPGRGLDDLLTAAGAEDVMLSMRIRMADPDALREIVASRGLSDRVRVLDPVPPAEVLGALDEFDVGVIFDRPQSRNSDLSLPNKFFEYLMAGLAVVAPHLETIGPVVEGEGLGVTYAPDDPDGLRSALERLARDRAELGAMRARARALALSRLNAEAAVEVLTQAWGDNRADAR
jgi:glycosyltransferase involved in cell wall biosynthesis